MKLAKKPVLPSASEDNSPSIGTKAKTSLGQKLLVLVSLGLCGAGVVAISRLALMDNSVRLDEAQSLWQTSHSLLGTLRVVAQDVHVPLYHVLLHFWQMLVGQDIQTARWLSLGFFLATIPVVYLLARRVLSVSWALLAVLLFSFSPFMNWYANEARMYALLALVVALSQYFFLKLLDSSGNKGWIGYVLTAMVGVYTHYFFSFNLLAQGIYFLSNRSKFGAGMLKKLTVLAVVLLIELTPWLVYYRSLGSASNTSPNLPQPSTIDLSNVYSQFLFGFQNNSINTALVSTWPLLVVVALLGVKYGQRLTSKTGYMIVAAFVPVLIAFALSHLISPFFLSRYMIASLAPLLILGVWFISHYKRTLRISVVSLVVLVTVAVSWQQYFSPTTPVKEDYKAAASVLNTRAKAHDIIVLSAPFTVYPLEYYYTGQARMATLPLWDRTVPGAIPSFDPAELPAQVDELNNNHQYVYLLLSYDQGYEDQVFQYYEQRFERVDVQQFSADLKLYVYRVGYSIAKPVGEF